MDFKLFEYFKQTTFSFRFFLKTIIFSIIFLSLSMILLNIPNFLSIGLADYSFLSKLKIFGILFIGSFSNVSEKDLFLLSVTGILFGANLELVLQKLKFLKKQPNLNLTLGSGILSLASTGCASCGLSIVSFIGLGGALAALPFGGTELYIFSMAILLTSFFYNLNSIYKACKI